MAVTRTFLGWDGPPLVRACDSLLSQGGDLSLLAVVTPGRRAARLLLGLLVDRAQGKPISPPLFVTPGEVADVVLGEQGIAAGPVQRRVAWERALERCGELEHLAPPSARGRVQHGMATILERCHEELTGEGLRFADVPGRASGIMDEREAARWQDAARVQMKYEEELTAAGLIDVGLARLRALERGVAARPGKIVLVGVPDLNAVASRALMLPEVEVEAMIAAPASLKDAFDDLGIVKVDAWKAREVPLREEDIIFADGPADQAGFAMEALAALEGRYPVHEVAIGIADASVAPHLERAARRCAGVTARPAAGSPLRLSSVARLLDSMRALLEEGTYAALAALVRHPDMERYLLRSAAGTRAERWLGIMDEYAANRLPTAVPPETRGELALDAAMGGVIKSVRQLLAPLVVPRPHPNHLLAVMQRLYAGNRVSREDPSAAETIRACGAIQKAVAQCAAMPEAWHSESGAALIRLVLEACGDSPLPPEISGDSLELLGWLELPLDPTPVAIVTGVNDGMLPESYGDDPLLPDGLRAKLGIACSDRRLARDAFLMTLLVHSREHVTLISGRRDGDGDPLLPSRLLFAADSETVVERVRRMSEKDLRRPRVRVIDEPVGVDRFPVLPRVEVAMVDSMRVTAFRTYLASPYLFYLEQVLRLNEVDRPELEIDPMRFGVLIHEALERFGNSDAKGSADVRKIRECMLDHLGTLAAECFGPQPAMAVRVQVEMARLRLEEVAIWQADWRSKGWLIHQTEWKPEGGVELPGMDKPFRIRGKIDRVDLKEGDKDKGAAIIDFKTGETVEDPGKSHGKPGRWKDLQLPLYRHLARDLKLPPDKLVLGYVAVPSRPGEVGWKPAAWSEADLADADAKAREVAEKVRRGEFFELGSKPPEEGTLAAISGTALVSARPPGEAVDDD